MWGARVKCSSRAVKPDNRGKNAPLSRHRAMKGGEVGREFKVGVIMLTIVTIICIAYTAFYLSIGMQRIDHYMSLGFLVLLVVVVAIMVFIMRRRALVREELMRRIYLSDEWIFNYEIGYAPFSKVTPEGNAYEFITFAAESLAEMSYGFEVADPPENFEPRLLVASRRFRVHRSGEGLVIDRWRGALQRLEHTPDGETKAVDVGTFANAKQLVMLLEKEDMFYNAIEAQAASAIDRAMEAIE